MVLPNFIFAGAPKSGSSSLFEYIRQHPDICMSDVKEPFFFDFNYEKGLQYYGDFFKHHNGEKIVGEATVWYMSWPSVSKRMYETIPNVKLMFVLRNPIDRAFSNYMMDLRGGHYTPAQTFGYVIRNESRAKGLARRIVSGGFYYQHLKHFEEYFRRDQFLIIPYQDLKQDLRAVERKVYKFLDVDHSFQATASQNRMIAPYQVTPEILARVSDKLPLFNFLWKKSRHFRDIFYDFNNKQKNAMKPADRNFLEETYAEQNALLEKHFNISFTK